MDLSTLTTSHRITRRTSCRVIQNVFLLLLLLQVERSIVRIQSAIRTFLQRQSMKKPLNEDEAALIIQKTFRGFRFRKTFFLYKQRLEVQTLCFLQQIDLINQDFYTKIVRTNYCVAMKSIETLPTAKVLVKSVPMMFPTPPPLPLPSPSAPSAPTISTTTTTTTGTTKFNQVRDVFARVSTISSPKTTNSNVLNAVQEYQRQHLKSHQPSIKRLTSVSNGQNHRTNNLIAMKTRTLTQSIGNFKLNSNIIMPVKVRMRSDRKRN